MIEVKDISVQYKMVTNAPKTLKEYMVRFLSKDLKTEVFRALKNVSFSVERGETVGIIGKNGAGKSTLLKVIAGVLTPTTGVVSLQGEVVPLLELGSGFDFELSGRENIYLNGAVLGYSKDFLDEHCAGIISFSELDKFIDMPVRNYSSGMFMRLAFSIATAVKPKILIVDEILSVGDAAFQAKSKQRMQDLMDEGTTVLFVSHSIEQVKELCSKTVWLDQGRIVAFGKSQEICQEYQAQFAVKE